jgi:hypothetical protein
MGIQTVDVKIEYAKNEFRCQKEELKLTAPLQKALSGLDGVMQYRTYLVGHAITAADIAVVCSLHPMYTKNVINVKAYDSYPNLTRYFLQCVNQPHFQSVFGKSAVPIAAAKWLDAPAKSLGGGKGGSGKAKGPKTTTTKKKTTKLGLTVSKDNFADWYPTKGVVFALWPSCQYHPLLCSIAYNPLCPPRYTDTIVKAEMIEYFDISGCYILRPWYVSFSCVSLFTPRPFLPFIPLFLSLLFYSNFCHDAKVL